MNAPLPVQERPLPPEVVSAAVDWLVELWSGTASADTLARCQAWRAAHPLHEQAWQQVEVTNARLSGAALSGPLALATLARSRQAQQGRRRVLRGVLGLAVVGGTTWALQSQSYWRTWDADVRTAKGEQQPLQLPDGSALLLNTDTALRLRFGDTLRCVELLQGELLATTASDPAMPARPFVVDTPAGRVQALGTRFSVRHDRDAADRASQVAVYQGAVEVHTRGDNRLRVEAGHGARFSATRLQATDVAGEGPDWAQGVLVATGMRLVDFVAELRRYRPGLVSLAPEVAELRLSGVFPLQDTDRILRSLAQVLPVEVHAPLGLWVRITPAANRPSKKI